MNSDLYDKRLPSRRAVLKGGVATVALLGMVGCTTSNSSDGENNSGGQGSSTLIIGEAAQLTSLDREYEIGQGSFEAMYNVYEPLVEFKRIPFAGSDGSYYLDYDPANWEMRALAENPAVSDDGLTWTLKFRDDITSHSGNPLIAEDFAYGIMRHQALWALGSFYNFVAGLMPRERKSWNIVDDHTLEVSTEYPSPLFKVLMENNAAFGLFDSKAIKANATEDDPWAKSWVQAHGDLAGHGAYTVTENVAGQQTTFAAFDKYYRGTPKLSRVVAKVVSNNSSAVSLLSSGGIQVMRDLLPVEFDTLKEQPNLAVDNFDKGRFQLLFLMLNNKVPPFDNKLVRQAIAWATPYNEIVDNIYKGYASRWNGIISQDYPLFDADAWPYGEGSQIDKAKDLLSQAGVGTLPSIQLMYSTAQPVHAQVARTLQSTLSQIGLELVLQDIADATFTTNLTGHKYEAAVWQDLALTPDIGYAVDLYFLSTAAVNVMQYSSSEVDRLGTEILKTLDLDARTTAASELQRQVLEDSPAVFLAQPHFVIARAKNVKGVTAAPSRALQFFDITVE